MTGKKDKTRVIPIEDENEEITSSQESEIENASDNEQSEPLTENKEVSEERIREIEELLSKKDLKTRLKDIVGKVKTYFTGRKVSSVLEKTVDELVKKNAELNREALISTSADMLSQQASTYSEEALLSAIRHRLLFEDNSQENLQDKVATIVDQFETNGEERIEQTVKSIVSRVAEAMLNSIKNDKELKELREKAGKMKILESELEQKTLQISNLVKDYENLKRRSKTELEEIKENANGELLKSLLPVLDMFERGFQTQYPEEFKSFIRGFEMIYENCFEILRKNGLEEQVALHQPFDPDSFEGLVSAPCDEYPDNTVIEVFEKGYTYKDKVLRHAKVKVSVNTENESKTEQDNQE